MPDLQRPPIVNKSDERYFSIKTAKVEATVKTAADGSETKVIRGIASSTVQDRMGDFLTEACQVSMLDQCKGMTMWLNHSYKVPEDILGTLTDATLQRSTDAQQGDCIDLMIEVTIDETNPRALQAWTSVAERGVKLGFSIGGYFLDVTIDEDERYYYALTVNDIELLEISLVGIPANPRAYTKAFEAPIEALKAAIVKRAEQIVKEGKTKAEAGILVKKSLFGGSEEQMDQLETPAADAPELTDAEVVNEAAAAAAPPEAETAVETPAADAPATAAAPVVETKDVMPEAKCSATVEAMKCIKSAMSHGMCKDAAASSRTGHAILKAMLPDDYDVPDDATLDDSSSECAAADLVVLSADAPKLRAQVDEAKAALETLSAERETLEQKIAELKATPTGRQTSSSHSGGSTKGSEPIADASLYHKSATELTSAIGKSVSGPSDARTMLR
jgi:phage head maturation protease